MSSHPKTPSNAADWDLIEAGSVDTASSLPDHLEGSLETLKLSFDNNLTNVLERMDANTANLDVKLQALDKRLATTDGRITTLNTHVVSLKHLIEEERKFMKLEIARSLTDLGSFPYYKTGYASSFQSSALAKEAIGWFMLNRGYVLPGAMLKVPPGQAGDGKEAFREKFKTQMKELIKREPRMSLEDGVWKIYYS